MKFKVFRFKKVNSTNSTAVRILEKFKINYGMIVSDTQKNGRGQYGKSWISYRGNLFISFFFSLDYLKVSISKLTKINCLLVKKILNLYCKEKIIFKKPNDLLINKKKICGILQEKLSRFGKNYLIVGVGINLIKNPNFKSYPTTNLYKLINKEISKSKIENKLKKIFELKLTKLYNQK